MCELCELANHHTAIFPSKPYKASKPFSLIYSDVRGPSRVSIVFEKKNSLLP